MIEDSDLETRLRIALGRQRSAVTADEVLSRVDQPDTRTDRSARQLGSRRLKGSHSPKLAWVWLGAVILLVVVAVVGFQVASPTKAKVVSPPPVSVPTHWQKVTFGGLEMLVPSDWHVSSENSWGDCGAAGQPLFEPSSVVLDSGENSEVYHCPAITSESKIPSQYGLVVDPGEFGPISGEQDFRTCTHVHDLSVCPTSTDYGGIFVAAVHIPGVSRPVAVEIGLAGGGKVEDKILHSMQSGPAQISSCTASQMTVKATRQGGAASHMGIVVTFRNATHTSCSIGGFPMAWFVSATGSRLSDYSIEQGTNLPPTVLASGGLASTTVWTPDPGMAAGGSLQGAASCEPKSAAGINIAPPGGAKVLFAPLAISVCTSKELGTVTSTSVIAGTEESL